MEAGRIVRAMKDVKIVIEKHPDGFVAYPIGMKGVCVAEGETYEEALAEARSAAQFHRDTFGADAFSDDETPVLEAFIAETALAIP